VPCRHRCGDAENAGLENAAPGKVCNTASVLTLHRALRFGRVHSLIVSARCISHCVGAHAVGATSSSSEYDSDDVVQIDSDSDQSPPAAAAAAVTGQQSQDLCEVCLVEERVSEHRDET